MGPMGGSGDNGGTQRGLARASLGDSEQRGEKPAVSGWWLSLPLVGNILLTMVIIWLYNMVII